MEEDGEDEATSSRPTKIRAIIRRNGDDDSERPHKVRPTAPQHTPAPRRNARNSGMELMSKLTSALDPSLQQARDEERTSRSLQNTQFLSLSQQLRDANSTIENLRQQLNNFQTRLHDSERARDRAELKLEMVELSRGRPSQRARTHRTESTKRTLQRIRGKVRCEERYPEGGSHTYWVTDPSSSSDDNKENVRFPRHRSPSHCYSPPKHSHSYSRHRRYESTNYFEGSMPLPPSPFAPSAFQILSSNTDQARLPSLATDKPLASKADEIIEIAEDEDLLKEKN